MWTYTLYMLDAFIRRNNQYDNLKFDDFAKFVFDELWKQQRIVFHDSKKDLRADLVTIDKLGIIEFNERLDEIDLPEEKREKFLKVAEEFRNDPMRNKIPLVDIYLRKVDALVK